MKQALEQWIDKTRINADDKMTAYTVVRAAFDELKERWMRASLDNPNVTLDALFASEFRALEYEWFGSDG